VKLWTCRSEWWLAALCLFLAFLFCQEMSSVSSRWQEPCTLRVVVDYSISRNLLGCIDTLAVFLVSLDPLPSARKHPSYGDCLEVKREYYQNCSLLGCVTHCSQSAAHSYEQFLQVQQIGFVTLGPLRHA